MNPGEAISLLRSHKKRITRTRKLTLELIYSKGPIPGPDLLKALRQKNHKVNKSTLYREIKFLLNQGLIMEVKLNPYIVHYESAHLNHHHHLVCENCGDIEEIVCNELERPILDLEKRIAPKFLIKKHNLEFYGVCSACN